MLLSDVALTSPCLRSGTAWKLQADIGQILNISLVNFKESSNQRHSCGKVKDVLTGNEVTLTPAARTQKLLVSHGNEIEISFGNTDCRVGLDISGKTENHDAKYMHFEKFTKKTLNWCYRSYCSANVHHTF